MARVLIIDDEVTFLRSLERSLSPPHEVIAMSDSRAALDSLVSGLVVDVIFCDVRMPAMSGPQLLAQLGEHKPHLVAQLLFLTATPDGVTHPHGEDHVLTKPASRVVLFAAVERVLGTTP